MPKNSGDHFRQLVKNQAPLQVVGTINAYCALLAQHAGHHAIYLSGAGVANMSYGLPDLGITTLDNVLEDARRITSAVDLPLLVDIDTGWGNSMMIARTIKQMASADVAAVHIEDQVTAKRCGHRPGKALVDTNEMVDRIKAAVDARPDESFVVMARTDALEQEGLEHAIERCIRYREAGADMLFPEALTELGQYTAFKEQVGIPILANITEFGKTPLFTTEELAKSGVDMVLYPLSAARAMNQAALNIYSGIRKDGTQSAFINAMQTRQELYGVLGYEAQEQKINEIQSRG